MRICAGGLLVRGDKILLAKRSEDQTFYPGVWDIIGGHCEGDERPADTLVRELKEEVGVQACAFEEIAVLGEPHPAAHGEARYHVFIVTAWDGAEPRLLRAEHSALRWVSLDQALALPLAHPAYGGLFQAVLGRGSAREQDSELATCVADCASRSGPCCARHNCEKRTSSAVRLWQLQILRGDGPAQQYPPSASRE